MPSSVDHGQSAQQASASLSDINAWSHSFAVERLARNLGVVAEQLRTGEPRAIGGAFLLAAKGAPEAILPHAARYAGPNGDMPLDQQGSERLQAKVEELGRQGLRVLAVAEGAAPTPAIRYRADLTLLGLVGLHDPPRRDIGAAIAACQGAGIRVVMVTGDHAVTAASIARSSRLAASRRWSKAVPLPAAASSPPPRSATPMCSPGLARPRSSPWCRHIRQARSYTIVAAIREGRVIFANIRRFVLYLIACNLGEVMVVSIAVAAGLPLPLLPLQILFLNVTDVFPAFALAMTEGGSDVMHRSPRDPREPIVTGPLWALIVAQGLTMTVATLAAM